MKRILSYAFMFLCAALLNAQDMPIDSKTGKITYLEVVETPNLTAKDLYKISKDWAQSKGLKVSKDNEAEGELTFDGALPMEYERTKGTIEKSKVTYKFHVFTKDGKYRYIATDFVQVGSNPSITGGRLELATPQCSNSGINAANWSYIKKRTQSSIETLITDFKRIVKEAQNDPTKSKDW